jgi:uncharacterized protein with PIN domain
MWERWAIFFSKIHIKSTIHSINKKIDLFFKVTNYLSTVKNSEITIINFREKRIILKTRFWTISASAMGEMGHIVFVSMGDMGQQKSTFV